MNCGLETPVADDANACFASSYLLGFWLGIGVYEDGFCVKVEVCMPSLDRIKIDRDMTLRDSVQSDCLRYPIKHRESMRIHVQSSAALYIGIGAGGLEPTTGRSARDVELTNLP